MHGWPISIALLIWKFNSCRVLFLVYQTYKSLQHSIYHLIFAQYNTLYSHKINILRAWAADARLTGAFAMASVTGANYCPDA